jgi:predicted PurR-regulated permease PerM
MMTWKKLAVMTLTVLSLLIIWKTHQIWAAAFLGVLIAFSLNGPAEWLRQYVRIPTWLATSLVIFVLFVVLTGLGWIIASPLSVQFDQLFKELPAATEKVFVWLDQRPWGQSIVKRAEEWSGMSHSLDEDQPDEETSSRPDYAQLLGHVAGALSVTVKTGSLLIVSIVVMIFVAFDPHVYERGVIWLVPKEQDEIARQTMDRLRVAMRWWMVGRLTSMMAVGLLTSLGMWMIGMPAPLALGAIAGLLSFVPNIGPIVAALPGLLLALGQGPWMVLWAGLIYLAAQFVESNAITPLVEQYAIAVPPGILIVTQFVFASLGGVWGMIISTPLLVVVMVLVQQLYINQALHKPIEVTGST